jgi:mannose-6-phosphate isomerase-like protein (cupin superfamily)
MRYILLDRDAIGRRLSGTEADLQRFASLIGRQNAAGSFAGMFVRRHRGDLEHQPWRHHPDEEVEFIVSGRIVVQIGSPEEGAVEQFEAGQGDLFCIPAGIKHRADSVGDELCVGLVFCPKPYDIGEGQPVVLS